MQGASGGAHYRESASGQVSASRRIPGDVLIAQIRRELLSLPSFPVVSGSEAYRHPQQAAQTIEFEGVYFAKLINML
jgi:hypothetical protein